MKQRILFASILLTLSSSAWPSKLDQIKQLIATDANQQALEQIDAQLAEQPKDPEALFLRAIILGKLQRQQEAIELYNELVSSYPTLPEPHNNLAVLYAQQGEFQASEQELESALNTDPSYATAHRNLSDIYKTLASIAYNKALNLDNGNKESVPETNLQLIVDLRSYHNDATVEVSAPVATTTALSVANIRSEVEPFHPKNEKPVDIKDIEEVIGTWAAAWSAQDVQAYLDHYSPDFVPNNRLTRTDWEEQRRQRLKSPGFIRVEVSRLETMILDNHIASASFDQKYHSDRFTEFTHKLVLLRQEEGHWRIVQETETK